MAKRSKQKRIWCIAYINRDRINIAEQELNKYGYDVKAYIPTVRMLKKKFKGKDIFEFIPLLFNYGFFNVSLKDAKNPEFLMELRNRITCIIGWVKDPTKAIGKSPRLKADNSDTATGVRATALATDAEVARLVTESQAMSIYSAEDLARLQPGDYIKLKGYPFDDMPAEIISINAKKKEVKVSLQMDVLFKNVTVSFENVFYTVYQGLNEKSREESYDELHEKYGQHSVDKMLFQNIDLDG